MRALGTQRTVKHGSDAALLQAVGIVYVVLAVCMLHDLRCGGGGGERWRDNSSAAGAAAYAAAGGGVRLHPADVRLLPPPWNARWRGRLGWAPLRTT